MCSRKCFLIFCVGVWLVLAVRMAAEDERYPHVVICSDAGVGGHEGLPDIARLHDGRLICVFYAGYAHGSPPTPEHPKGGRIMAAFSSDRGATWTKPEVLVDTEWDDRDPCVTRLFDGRVLVTYINSGTATETVRGTWMMESADGAKTWSSPRRIVADWYATSAICELLGGKSRLVLPMYCMFPPTHSRGGVLLSSDGGRTWGAPVEIDNGGRSLDAETAVVELPGGRLLAMERGRAREAIPMHASWSEDEGHTWSSSVPMNFLGITPALLQLKDVVVMAYGPIYGKSRWGTALRISADEGRNWSEPEIVDDVLGCHPSTVQLEDGSVLIAYYDERVGSHPSERSDVRLRRFRMNGSAIEWLPITASP